MKVTYQRRFLKDIQNIKDKNLNQKIVNVIEEIKSTESLQNLNSVKKLKGHSNAYRIRVGDYRIGLLCDGDGIVELARVAKRNDIYKVFP